MAIPPSPSRPAAAVNCPHCMWGARMSGDSLIEIAQFLNARLTDHLDVHDTPPTPTPPARPQ